MDAFIITTNILIIAVDLVIIGLLIRDRRDK